jgi:cytochrome P450
MEIDAPIEELARNYDHFSVELARHAPAVWARMREECPVAHSENYGGFYVLTRYEDVWKAATDWKTFTSAERVAIPPNEFPPALPIEVDPPLHREYRRVLNAPLGPQTVIAHEPDMRGLAKQLIGEFAGAGTIDFHDAYADPFVKLSVLRAVGVPESDREHLTELVEQIATHRDVADQIEPTMKLLTYLMEKTAERRAGPPRDDVFGALVAGEIDGRPLSDEEVVGNMITTIFGGIHTTTGFLNNVAHWLVLHPDERQRLLREPELLPTAIEEFLRYLGTNTGLGRTATTDIELHGCPIRKGEKVMLSFGSANFDAREFDRPNEVVLDRQRNRQLSFGAGPHHCVGAHLARLMIRVSLEELAPVLGDFDLADAETIVWSAGESRSIHRLPLVRRGG